MQLSDLRHFLAETTIVITAITLIYVAIADLREFKIRNEFVISLACLFGIYSLLSGQWVSVYWNIAIAVFMFAVLLAFYSQNWMGGGDVKILTVGFLWVGIHYALPFAVLLLLASLAQVLAAKCKLTKVLHLNGRARMAFAPSVAAALIGVFVLRWVGI